MPNHIWEVHGYTEDGWEIRDPKYFHAWGEMPWPEKEWLVGHGFVLVTNESWGGTFGGGRLALSLYEYPPGTPEWTGARPGECRIVIDGTDDWSMYRRNIPHRQAAEAILRRLPVVVSSDTLRELGFTPD